MKPEVVVVLCVLSISMALPSDEPVTSPRANTVERKTFTCDALKTDPAQPEARPPPTLDKFEARLKKLLEKTTLFYVDEPLDISDANIAFLVRHTWIVLRQLKKSHFPISEEKTRVLQLLEELTKELNELSEMRDKERQAGKANSSIAVRKPRR